jgi:hypothetical protein
MGKAIELRRAGADDIPFIMRTERLEGYSDMVGCWDESRHRAALADPHSAYFIAGTSDRLVGFALLTGLDAADRVTLIKRVAVTEPGKGYGKALVRAVADAAFSQTEVWRASGSTASPTIPGRGAPTRRSVSGRKASRAAAPSFAAKTATC